MYRSLDRCWAACGGLGAAADQRVGISHRLVLLSVVTLGALLYLILWMLIPQRTFTDASAGAVCLLTLILIVATGAAG
jgi:hypothetical protein